MPYSVCDEIQEGFSLLLTIMTWSVVVVVGVEVQKMVAMVMYS